VDRSGNRGGVTWNWGYANASQVSADGSTLAMHSASGGAATSSGDIDNDPQHGFELTYNRELGHKGIWHWGVEAAGGWTDLVFRDNRPLPGNTTVLTDTFSLGTPPIVPGTAPYHWPFNPGAAAPGGAYWTGPSAVIGDSPLSRSSSVAAGGSTITGYRDLTADLFSLRLGPYLELPIIKKKLNLR